MGFFFFFLWPNQGGWNPSESLHTHKKIAYSSGKGAYMQKESQYKWEGKPAHAGKCGIPKVRALSSHVKTATPYHSGKEPFSRDSRFNGFHKCSFVVWFNYGWWGGFKLNMNGPHYKVLLFFSMHESCPMFFMGFFASYIFILVIEWFI